MFELMLIGKLLSSSAPPAKLLCLPPSTTPSVTSVPSIFKQFAPASKSETVFGNILRGQAPCKLLKETPNSIAFVDQTNKARFHSLVIPKAFVHSVKQLTPSHIPLLKEMEASALEQLKTYEPSVVEKKDYQLCFHVPPHISVGHLHLHVLAPASEMTKDQKHRFREKFRSKCQSLEYVLTNLQKKLLKQKK